MNDATETETQRIFVILKQKILQKQLAAGASLSHSQLCRDLQTSRTPVREALSRLEGLGLVTTIPHRGTFVVQLDLRDFMEITQIRMLLESFAARQAAGHISSADLDNIQERLLALHRNGPTEQDYEALHTIDADLHQLINHTSGNRRLETITETMRNLCEQFSFDSRVRFGVMIDELLALIDALRAGSGDRAEQLMRQHINNFGEALPTLMTR